MIVTWHRLSTWLERRGRSGRLAVMLALILPLIIISGLNLVWSRRDLTDSTLERRMALAELAGVVLDNKFDHLMELGTSLAMRVRFRELVAAGQWWEAIKILEEIPEAFVDINRIFLTDTNGVLMAQTPVIGDTVGQKFSHRDWYAGVSKEWKPYISEVYQRAAEPRYVVAAVAVPIRQQAAVMGILVMQVRVSTFSTWLDELNTEATSIYFVDKNGHVSGHPDVPDDQIVSYRSAAVVQKVLSGHKGVEVMYNAVDREHRVSAYLPLPEYGWGVVAYEPVASAFEFRTRQLINLAVIHGFILLLMIMLSYSILQLLDERHRRAEESARLHDEIKKRAKDLEVANRELESFSYSISHDLRTPLSSIYGYMEMIKEEHAPQLNEDGRRLIGIIQSAAVRMGSMIDDLLEFSRQSTLAVNRTNINMNNLVAEVVETFQAQVAGRLLKFEVDSLPEASGDASMIKLVLQNLIQNAVKFTRNKECAVIHISGTVSDHEAIFTIKDNGAGFDMKYADKLFRAFERLHSNHEFEGTGIGLSIVGRIINRHGGRVWAKGKPGEGAEFNFTLPVPDGVSPS